MGLKMGIVGLPNVGKSTLFNAITNSAVDAANYPFATINPNVGIVELKDKRLEELKKAFNPQKVSYTTFEFIDIAGLIKNASKGEGLGNKFLANISETNAICQVVRCFENKNITHVEGSVDSVRDVEIINIELIINDQAIVERQLQKYHKLLKGRPDRLAIQKYELLQKLKKYLNENILLNQFDFNDEEKQMIKEFNLLTIKPFIYVANVSEADLSSGNNAQVKKLKDYAKKQKINVIELCAEFEKEISKLDEESKEMFMQEYNIKYSGLNKLVQESYKLLGLETFFTAGPKEVRAWTFKKGSYAPQCAGIIHTDFEKGFIKVEVYSYEDFLQYKSEKIIKEKGKVRLEGKKYQLQDGDICYFKFNV